MCSEGKPVRDANGRFLRWDRTTHRIAVKAGLRDTTVAEYRMFEFDKNGKQISDIQCVLFSGDSAKTFARTFQSRYTGQRGSAFIGQQSIAANFYNPWDSYFCMNIENDTKIYCNFGGSGIICTPVIFATESAPGSDAIRLQPKLLFENGSVDCVFVGGGYGTDAPGPDATTPPGASSDGGRMTYYDPPSGSFGGTLGGGSYEYAPPTSVNCELGGCGNGGGEPCYATIRIDSFGLSLECPEPPDWNDGGNGPPTNLEAAPSLSAESSLWSKWAHDQFIDMAFKNGGCSVVNDILKAASLDLDLHHNSSSYDDVITHAMMLPNMNPLAPQQGAVHIQERIDAKITFARGEAVAGRWRSAMISLGHAIHTITDRLSPAHSDNNGHPLPWPPERWGQLFDHSLIDQVGKETTRDITPYIASLAVNELVTAMSNVTQGLTRPSCSSQVWQ